MSDAPKEPREKDTTPDANRSETAAAKASAEKRKSELSDEQIAAIAGGASFQPKGPPQQPTG